MMMLMIMMMMMMMTKFNYSIYGSFSSSLSSSLSSSGNQIKSNSPIELFLFPLLIDSFRFFVIERSMKEKKKTERQMCSIASAFFK
jgi:phosphotransferase system  glucose/maltose/N-acetylglucosamine-specific IIC component